jgi:hypothetical protein
MIELAPRSFDIKISDGTTLKELLEWIANREGEQEGNIRINCSNYNFNGKHLLKHFIHVFPFRECVVSKGVYSIHNDKYLYDIMIRMPDLSTKDERDKVVDTLFDDFEKAKEELLSKAPLKWAMMEAELSRIMVKNLRGD